LENEAAKSLPVPAAADLADALENDAAKTFSAPAAEALAAFGKEESADADREGEFSPLTRSYSPMRPHRWGLNLVFSCRLWLLYRCSRGRSPLRSLAHSS
jgi:hypothetical protein